MGREKMKSFFSKFAFEIETAMQLLVVITAASIFGIMEAKFITTETLTLNVMGHFSYYHVGLLSLMAVTSFAMAFSRIQHLLLNRKKYTLLMCLGSVPLALMVEDIVWFLVEQQAIARDEWTMVFPGWGINLGFTWIPLWYILVTAFTVTSFVFAHKLEEKGREEYIKRKHRRTRSTL